MIILLCDKIVFSGIVIFIAILPNWWTAGDNLIPPMKESARQGKREGKMVNPFFSQLAFQRLDVIIILIEP